MLLIPYLRSFCLTQGWKDFFHVFSSKICILLGWLRDRGTQNGGHLKLGQNGQSSRQGSHYHHLISGKSKPRCETETFHPGLSSQGPPPSSVLSPPPANHLGPHVPLPTPSQSPRDMVFPCLIWQGTHQDPDPEPIRLKNPHIPQPGSGFPDLGHLFESWNLAGSAPH